MKGRGLQVGRIGLLVKKNCVHAMNTSECNWEHGWRSGFACLLQHGSTQGMTTKSAQNWLGRE